VRRALASFAWVFASLWAGCAAHTAAPPAAARVAAPADPHALERLLVERCGACHDGEDPRRPVFDEGRTLSRIDAMRVGLFAASRLMPPPPTRLPDDVRRRLITLACERAATRDEPAAACTGRLDLAPPEHWLISMEGMLGVAERLAQAAEPDVRFDPKAKKALEATFRLVDPETRSIRLDASLATLIALHAAERCGDPAVVGEAPFRACVTAITNYRKMALPEREPATPQRPR
jgi:hypothetical protein